jgi:hypothetical protein
LFIEGLRLLQDVLLLREEEEVALLRYGLSLTQVL